MISFSNKQKFYTCLKKDIFYTTPLSSDLPTFNYSLPPPPPSSHTHPITLTKKLLYLPKDNNSHLLGKSNFSSKEKTSFTYSKIINFCNRKIYFSLWGNISYNSSKIINFSHKKCKKVLHTTWKNWLFIWSKNVLYLRKINQFSKQSKFFQFAWKKTIFRRWKSSTYPKITSFSN